jgi:hypothetical protein
MKLANFIRVVLILIILAVVGISVFRATRQGNVIEFNSRTLTRDTWGAPPTEKMTSNVYLNKDHTFGWYWNRANPVKLPGNTFVQPIFPNVRIGADFGAKSNSSSFPVKTGAVQNLNFSVDFQYVTPPIGNYNFAYQMYFTDTDKPGVDATPKAVVMIWLHHTFNQPSDRYKGDFSDGTNTYELYSCTFSDGRQYYSFLLKGRPLLDAQYNVNAKTLLDSLSLDPELYLLGVSLGNEIWSGSGKIEIRKVTVNLNGNQI